jgi:hypothetical protein
LSTSSCLGDWGLRFHGLSIPEWIVLFAVRGSGLVAFVRLFISENVDS